MGTRGMIGLVSDGTVYGSYVHFDSYPSGLGEKIAAFVTHVRTVGVDTVKAQVTRLSLVDEETKPTAEQRKRYEHLTDAGVSEGDDWYAILRHAQGDLQAYLDAEIWVDGLGFAGDSLMCEWGYLVNLDEETVELFRGFSKGITRGRFAGLANRDPQSYGPITLLAEVPFDVAAQTYFWTDVEDVVYQAEGEDQDVAEAVTRHVARVVSILAAPQPEPEPAPEETVTTTIRVRTRTVTGWGFFR
jgi:hypothetical protein